MDSLLEEHKECTSFENRYQVDIKNTTAQNTHLHDNRCKIVCKVKLSKTCKSEMCDCTVITFKSIDIDLFMKKLTDDIIDDKVPFVM
ncbi:hypothetical protein T11_12664 [Trichinella zimbabwensis]|uniref:Uncharacterized protein n=1 Tax=Trichinella zimbabwensis TaxID=268475 RepID=A0A0V1GWI6_9BILA|nr:hypothetical protein T11_12664 [Trichinella zimbabwensis]